MRSPCRFGCGTSEGYIRRAGDQDVVRCSGCHRAQYNASRVETGRAARTVTTVHNGIKPAQRARILMRDGRCILCGSRENLQVGHLIPVAQGLAEGLTELQLNDDENLAAQCAECNAGIGETPAPLWVTVPLLKLRLHRDRR